MNVKDHALKIGSPANIVVLGAPNVPEALRGHHAPLHVISHGKLIDRVRMESLSQRGEW
jgi:hypothetical protein